MEVFSSLGISVVALAFSFFHPAPANAQHRIVTYHRTPRVVAQRVSPMPTGITPTATSMPTQSTPPAQEDVKTFIMQGINDYRHSFGLSSVSTNDATCTFAKTRAQEISTNFSHDGFNQRVQNHSLPYPEYSFITENIAETTNYKEVVPMWIASSGHAENMRADTPFVCVEQSGNYFAYEGLKLR
jgi:uncharacterized protein YkwD